MTNYKLQELNSSRTDYQQKIKEINKGRDAKTAQYLGEGATFFLLIIIGAGFVFKIVRRQFKQSQQQQNFMTAITHELKTPIAITQLNLETLQKRTLSHEQQQKLITITIQETSRLNSLCNNLLMTSKIEAGNYQPEIENFNLGELLNESVTDLKKHFPDRNFIHEADDNIFFNGDKLMIQMAINNLLSNAIKYSARQEKIEANLKKHKDEIILSIKDEGNGIADEEKKKVFNKFYRTGNEYSKGAKGTGLGLYLTKKIVEQHKGEISIADNSPHGSIFEMSFKA